jgi:integrase
VPKKAKPRSAFELRRLKEPGKYAVGGVDGLYLNVRNELAKSWILRIVEDGRRRDLGLGAYPEVSLEQAREKAGRRKEGKEDPSPAAKPSAPATKAQGPLAEPAQPEQRAQPEEPPPTFEVVARECWAMKEKEFKNDKHRKQWISTLQQYAFPKLGHKHIADLRRGDIAEVLTPIWTRITDTATKVRQRIEAVINYGNAKADREAVNPASWEQLKSLLPSARKLIRRKKKHHPALPWRRMGEFMPLLQAEQTVTARALEFLILSAARTIEVRKLTPDQLDREQQVWQAPGDSMKGDIPHKVPLTDAMIRCLDATPRIVGSPYVFAGKKARQMLSENTMLKLVDKLTGMMEGTPKATTHGFRASFKTWHQDQPNFEDVVSELQLAHVDSDETRSAYARGELLPKRRVLMRQWTQFIYTKPKPTVVDIARAKREEAA